MVITLTKYPRNGGLTLWCLYTLASCSNYWCLYTLQSCSDYPRIKLLSYRIELSERLNEQRLRKETFVSKNKFGFLSEVNFKAIYLLKWLMERISMMKKDLHMVFI